MFDMHIRNMAEQKLATAEYGPVMLVTLGKVYKLSAKQAQGNMVAFFKCVPCYAVRLSMLWGSDTRQTFRHALSGSRAARSGQLGLPYRRQ